MKKVVTLALFVSICGLGLHAWSGNSLVTQAYGYGYGYAFKKSIPIFRLYNTETGVHVYTKGDADKDKILAKWPVFEFTDGGPAFYLPIEKTDGDLKAIYRLYNTKTGVHLYTRGKTERNYIMDKWPEFEFTDGKPAFYAALEEEYGATPIYRLYNTKTGVHVYTRGLADRNKVLNKWREFEYTDSSPAFFASVK